MAFVEWSKETDTSPIFSWTSIVSWMDPWRNERTENKVGSRPMEVRQFLKKVVNFAFVTWVNRPDIVGICKTGVSSGAILNPVRLVQGVHRTIEGDRRGSLRDCVDSLAELDCPTLHRKTTIVVTRGVS